MLNFLLDITPDKSQLLITIKLAGILREKKQEVYYTSIPQTLLLRLYYIIKE